MAAAKRSPAQRPTPPERPAWARLHLWQIQPVRDVLVALGILGLVVLGDRLSVVTVPLLLALLFAYLLEPVVKRLARPTWIGRRSAVIVLLVATTLLVVVPSVLGVGFGVVQSVRLAGRIGAQAKAVLASVEAPQDEELRGAVRAGAWLTVRDLVVELRQEAARLEALERAEAEAETRDATEGEAAGDPAGASVPEGEQDTSLLSVELLGIGARDLARVFDAGLAWLGAHAEELGRTALSTGRGAVTVALSTVVGFGKLVFGAFLTAFFFFFVSWRWGSVTEHLQGYLPERNRDRVLAILRRMDGAIAAFIRGRLTIAFLLAGFYSIGFWLIGVPAPLLLGPAIALLAIVPYAPVLGLPVVMLLLWLEPHTGLRGAWWWALAAPVVYYNLGQALDDYLLTPWIQGESTGLDTPTILFASIAGGVLMGFYGLLIAIPLAACIRILLIEVAWPRFQAWVEGRRRDFLPIDPDS